MESSEKKNCEQKIVVCFLVNELFDTLVLYHLGGEVLVLTTHGYLTAESFVIVLAAAAHLNIQSERNITFVG